MNEKQFLAQLEGALRAIPTSQREEILADYRSHFFEARERGKSEASIAEALGEPRTLARTFVADYHLQHMYEPKEGEGPRSRAYHLIRGTILVLTILAFNFFFMLWPVLFLGLCLGLALLLAVMGVGVGFGVVAWAIYAAFAVPMLGLAKLTLPLYGLSLLSGSLVAFLALIVITRLFVVALLKYIKINMKVL